MSGLKLNHFMQVLAMAVVMVCVLSAAGCITSSHVNETIAGNTSPSLTQSVLPTTIIPLPTPSPAQCPQESNTSLTLLSGDPFSYKGTVSFGNPSEVRVWIFGQNSSTVSTVPVQQDQSFLFSLTSEQTAAMLNGTYRILFEIPSSGRSYGMRIASIGKGNNTVIYDPVGIRVLDLSDITDNQISGPVAAATIEQAIRKTGTENVTGINLKVKDLEIAIDPIPDHTLGDLIAIGGTTNLHPGELLEVQIFSGYFIPCAKCQEIVNDSVLSCCGNGFLRQITVVSGTCGTNTWSVGVDTTLHNFTAGMPYVITVYGRNSTVLKGSTFTLASVQSTRSGS